MCTTLITLADSSDKAHWARNPWCITVLVAVLWGIIDDRNKQTFS